MPLHAEHLLKKKMLNAVFGAVCDEKIILFIYFPCYSLLPGECGIYNDVPGFDLKTNPLNSFVISSTKM